MSVRAPSKQAQRMGKASADDMAARLGLLNERDLIAYFRVAEHKGVKDAHAVIRRLVLSKKASHFKHGQQVFLSRRQLDDLDKRCTYMGSEPAYDWPPYPALSLEQEFESRVAAKRTLQRNWTRRRRLECPAYALNASMRKAVHGSLSGLKRGRSWATLTGYSLADLRSHIEALFVPGMMWTNYGTWHVDHIRPLSSFRISGPDCPQFREAWALDNLQPLWAIDNIRKGAKW